MNKLQKPMPLEEAEYKWELITLEKKGEDELLLGDMTGSVEDSLISFVNDDPFDPRVGEKLEKKVCFDREYDLCSDCGYALFRFMQGAYVNETAESEEAMP